MEISQTAEFVSPKHPDKVCDRIADAILDECLAQDSQTRSAVEVMGGHSIITVTGELTTDAYVNIPEIVRGIVGENIGVQVNITRQSPEIARGVDTGGAGDQGIMVGYATSETEELMPREYVYARELCRYLYEQFPEDGKTQITIGRDGQIKVVVASFNRVREESLFGLTKEFLKDRGLYHKDIRLLINPAGDWDIGGFNADTGVTGRKIVVDSYGPRVPVGGGAFSGKDPSKVDRSGAYAARCIAVRTLKQMKAKEVLVKLAYAIGVVDPVMISGEVDGKELRGEAISMNVKDIIDSFKLREPQYEKLAQWGHFGNNNLWDK